MDTLDPLSLLPLFHLSAIRLAKPWPFSSPPHHAVVLLEFLGGSTTSAAPLDRGNGGRHQAVRVTEYGGAAGCGVHLHDLEIGKCSTTSSTRIPLETLSVFEGEFSWNMFHPLRASPRLDLGTLVVPSVGIFFFSMLRTHQK